MEPVQNGTSFPAANFVSCISTVHLHVSFVRQELFGQIPAFCREQKYLSLLGELASLLVCSLALVNAFKGKAFPVIEPVLV